MFLSIEYNDLLYQSYPSLVEVVRLELSLWCIILQQNKIPKKKLISFKKKTQHILLIYLIVIRVRKKTQHGNVTRHFNLSMEEYFTEHKKKF